MVADFFNGTKTLTDLQTADEDPIKYVFYGPMEQSLRADTPTTQIPDWAKGMTIIYQQGAYAIFQVP
jgi:hypothetical protein